MIDDLITLDTDGDGISDAIAYWDENGLNYAYDTNLDGVWDMIETYSGFDEYGNPHHFEVQCDTDANGIMDRFVAADTLDAAVGSALKATVICFGEQGIFQAG